MTADPASDIVKSQPALALLLMGGALCNDAFLQPEGAHPGQYRAVGDPTEGALVVAASAVWAVEVHPGDRLPAHG